VRKGWQTGRLHWPGSEHKHEESEESEADLLAPLEETEAFKDSPQCDSDKEARDTIRVDNASVRMPEQLTEDEREGGSIFRLEPVVFFILAAMLAFIAFITWQITLMPGK
jgi:hypothetical protein